MTAFYPVFLDLRGRRAVVIGGGAVAEQKVRGLTAAGAHVTVVSPDLSPGLTDLAARGAIELRRRSYRGGDLAGAWLAIAASDDRAVNAAVWAEAERLGVPLNAVDDLELFSLIARDIHREGDNTVAVWTGGKRPALAVRLRQRIARLVGRGEARLCELLGELRPELATRVPDAQARTAVWYEIVDSDVIDFVRRGDVEGARGRIDELLGPHPLSPSPFGRGGTVYLVGAGPGDPGLITARGLELLRSAEVVVYDRLVSPALVAGAHAWVAQVGCWAQRALGGGWRAWGAGRDTPAGVVAGGPPPGRRPVAGPLDDFAGVVVGGARAPPATVVIGDVVRVGLTHPV